MNSCKIKWMDCNTMLWWNRCARTLRSSVDIFSLRPQCLQIHDLGQHSELNSILAWVHYHLTHMDAVKMCSLFQEVMDMHRAVQREYDSLDGRTSVCPLVWGRAPIYQVHLLRPIIIVYRPVMYPSVNHLLTLLISLVIVAASRCFHFSLPIYESNNCISHYSH